MEVMAAHAMRADKGSFEHAALFYRGMDAFVRDVGAFVAAGLAASEPVLVAVDQRRIESLRGALGASADHVEFADMTELGGNPARIINVWERFVNDRGANGRRVRGVGEPVWPERSAPELAECEVHEHLLNAAFGAGQAWSLVCPYDLSALGPYALGVARRTHPLIRSGMEHTPSPDYRGVDVFDSPLTEPEQASVLHDALFAPRDLPGLRKVLLDLAASVAVDAARASDLALVLDELATNSVLHGGGSGRIRTWIEDGSLVLEVRDAGRHTEELVGRRLPHSQQIGGRGLWMVNHLCDLLQLRNDESGAIARAHFRL